MNNENDDNNDENLCVWEMGTKYVVLQVDERKIK